MDLAAALSKKSVFVSTSTYEGFPLSFLEARDFGLPIVSFDCPTGPKEIIDDGVTGVLIKPYDEDKMLEKIIELIEDDEKRVEMSNNTLLSLNKFSKESSMKDWKELLLND